MKLTKREKNLLISLGVVLLVIGYYQFILSPQINKVQTLEAEAEAYRNEVNKVKIEISPKNKIHKDFKILNWKIAVVSQRLFPSIIQEKIITILDDKVQKSNIKALSMAFSEKELNEIEKKQVEKKKEDFFLKQSVLEYHGELDASKLEEDQTNNTQEENKDAQLEKMTSTISYEGSYQEILSLMRNIESFDKKIIVKNLNLVKSEEGPMAGNIVLDFYALPKIRVQDEEYLKWDFKNEYGKENPFSGYAYRVNTPTTNKSSKVRKKTYDFIMTVKPISSALPTVIIGRTNDQGMKTYVYADNPNIENVEFKIIEEDGKYFYKYKAGTKSYPTDYENNKIEFKANGNNVEFHIVTHARNGENDQSGVNLSLINQTKLNLNVAIDYDDKNKTRINVIKKIGNVSVKR